LIAPPSSLKQIGENIVIAWNGSAEQARMVALSIPLLRKANRVTVLSVTNDSMRRPSCEQLVRYLEFNEICASSLTVTREKRKTGATMLATAISLGCDLLVVGAFADSHLKRSFCGDAADDILAYSTLPVLVAQ
jgi:nucleotide-binding universal stress UspA family protein